MEKTGYNKELTERYAEEVKILIAQAKAFWSFDVQ